MKNFKVLCVLSGLFISTCGVVCGGEEKQKPAVEEKKEQSSTSDSLKEARAGIAKELGTIIDGQVDTAKKYVEAGKNAAEEFNKETDAQKKVAIATKAFVDVQKNAEAYLKFSEALADYAKKYAEKKDEKGFVDTIKGWYADYPYAAWGITGTAVVVTGWYALGGSSSDEEDGDDDEDTDEYED